MSEGEENKKHVHIRKKRLLAYRNEYPDVNKNGLNQQDANDEPEFVLVSFDENQLKNGNEDAKVLEQHANQEMHKNSYYENNFPHEQQVEVKKIPDHSETFCIEEHKENLNKVKQLCKKKHLLDETSREVIRELIQEEDEKHTQLNVNGQQNSGEVEIQLKNLFKSQINMTDDENEIKNKVIGKTNNNASVDNETETIHNESNSEINTDTENFASFDNLPQANFQNIACNEDNESHRGETHHINESDIENLKICVEYLKNVKQTKMDNLMKTAKATIQLVHFTEELEQQEESEEDENINNKDKKENKNLSHCPKSPEKEINIMKKALDTSKIELEKPQVENISIPSAPTSIEYPPQLQIKNRFEADENGMVCIGPNGTMVPRISLESVNWSLTGAAVTRKILVEIFGRETLAAHNLTGKPSPAFIDCNKPVKGQLDPIIVADLIHFMGEQKGLTPKEVRNAITTKCADENKMLRLKEKKRQSIAAQNMACAPY